MAVASKHGQADSLAKVWHCHGPEGLGPRACQLLDTYKVPATQSLARLRPGRPPGDQTQSQLELWGPGAAADSEGYASGPHGMRRGPTKELQRSTQLPKQLTQAFH